MNDAVKTMVKVDHKVHLEIPTPVSKNSPLKAEEECFNGVCM